MAKQPNIPGQMVFDFSERPEQPSLDFFVGSYKDRKKRRDIWIPSEEALVEHRTLLARLKAFDIPMPYATGSVEGGGIRTNIEAHKDNYYFYKTDITNAFPSVDEDILSDTLFDLIKPDIQPLDELWCLATQCWPPDKPGLPQGAPTSPFLFNIYCLEMDERIAAIAKDIDADAAYTRFVDDITISLPEATGRNLTKNERLKIRKIAAEYKLDFSRHKTQLHSLQNGPVTITGMSLYPKSGARRIQLKPELLNVVEAAFRTYLMFPDERYMGEINGYHGLLRSASPDPAESTDIEQTLIGLYEQIRVRNKKMGRQALSDEPEFVSSHDSSVDEDIFWEGV